MSTKKKSILRKESLIIIPLLLVLILLYLGLFFEAHLKWIAENSLTKTYGAEVNIKDVDMDWSDLKLAILRLQFTNHQKPTENLFEIGEFSVDFNKEDLMFLSFVADEAFIKDIKANTQRSYRGSVSQESQKIISVSLDLKKNKNKVIDDKTKGNILENALAFTKSNNIEKELNQVLKDLNVKDLEDKYKAEIESKKQTISKLNDFSDSEEFVDIKKRVKALEGKIKSDKLNISEVLKEGKTLLADLKKVKTQASDLKSEFKNQINDLGRIKSNFQSDLEDKKNLLKAKFQIPDISPDALARSFFSETINTRFYLFKHWLEQLRNRSEEQVSGYTRKVISEKNEKFLKDKVSKTLESSKAEKGINQKIADSRAAKNQIIHFGKKVHPKFWLKKLFINANANSNQDLQNFTGLVRDIADDQKLINKPIRVSLKGDLPKDSIRNINIDAKLNHHVSQMNEEFKVSANYPISSFKMINDDSLKLFIQKALSTTTIDGRIIQNKIQNFVVNNDFTNVDFLFNSSKGDIQEILKPILESIDTFGLDIYLKGLLDNPDLILKSSLTQNISEGLKKQLANQLNKVTAKFDAELNSKVKPIKDKIFSELNLAGAKTEGEIDSINSKVEAEEDIVNKILKESGSKGLKRLTDKLF